MCKYSPGCGSSDSFKCKSCGTALCKQCSRSLKTGNPPASGNGAQCGDCHKNFRWDLWCYQTTLSIYQILFIQLGNRWLLSIFSLVTVEETSTTHLLISFCKNSSLPLNLRDKKGKLRENIYNLSTIWYLNWLHILLVVSHIIKFNKSEALLINILYWIKYDKKIFQSIRSPIIFR